MTLTKLVISSDWHLNFNSQFDRTGSNGISTRLQDILDSVSWVSDVGKEHGADFFLTLGDMFERPDRLPTKEGLAIVECLRNIRRKYGNRLLAIPGNHDQINADHNIVTLFADIVTVMNKPTFLDIDGARLFFCPYIRETEDVYAVMDKFETMDCPGRKYLMAHFWDTSVMGVDPESVDLSRFNHKFFDRILLGHYHSPSNKLTDQTIYVGTLLNKKFSETGPKGCWILDVESNTLEFIKNPNSPEFYLTEDTVLLNDPTLVERRAYYRVQCDAENVVDVSKILGVAKGFELIAKKADGDGSSVSIDMVEKRNSLSVKEFIFANCGLYTPEGITAEEFTQRGIELLGDML